MKKESQGRGYREVGGRVVLVGWLWNHWKRDLNEERMFTTGNLEGKKYKRKYSETRIGLLCSKEHQSDTAGTE